MSQVTINFKSCGKEILATGVLHSFGADDIVIDLSDLKFIFKFINDSEGQRYVPNKISDKEMEYKLFNFNNPNGTTLMYPNKLGTYHGKELFMIFTVHKIGQSGVKLFHYTFFLGDNVNAK